MREFTPNAVAAIKAAIAELQTGEHVKPELDRVAIVGHSMGGAITPNLAVLAAEQGLPIPKAICCVEPEIILSAMRRSTCRWRISRRSPRILWRW